MKQIIPNIETEGFYMVKLNCDIGWNRGNSLKPAIITKYNGPTKYIVPRLYIEWFNGNSGTFEPKDVEVFELINKPSSTTNEQPTILANQKAFNHLRELASNANKSEDYREGYLDAYNHAKMLMRLIV